MKVLYALLIGVLVNKCISSPLTAAENEHRLKHCGVKPAHRQQKMAGGELIDPVDAPWAVGISWTQNDQPGTNWTTCSGTLISSRHVLTAASCIITSMNPTSKDQHQVIYTEHAINRFKFMFHARSGVVHSVARNDPLDTIGAKRVFVPRHYKEKMMSDIAVFELERNIAELMPGRVSTEISAACLFDSFPNLDTEVDIYGYGGDDQLNSANFGLLQHIKSRITNCADNSIKKFGSDDRIDEFCTMSDQHACAHGDTGAGSVISQNGRHSVVGVFSPSIYCNMNAPGAMESHVAVSAHTKWICRKTGICPGHHITMNPNVNSDDVVEAIETGGTKIHVSCSDDSFMLASRGTKALCFKVYKATGSRISDFKNTCAGLGGVLAPARNDQERDTLLEAATIMWEGPRQYHAIAIGGEYDTATRRFRWSYDQSFVSTEQDHWIAGNPSLEQRLSDGTVRSEHCLTLLWSPQESQNPTELKFNDVYCEEMNSAAVACAFEPVINEI